MLRYLRPSEQRKAMDRSKDMEVVNPFEPDSTADYLWRKATFQPSWREEQLEKEIDEYWKDYYKHTGIEPKYPFMAGAAGYAHHTGHEAVEGTGLGKIPSRMLYR